MTASSWGDLTCLDQKTNDKTNPDLQGVNSTMLLSEDVYVCSLDEDLIASYAKAVKGVCR